MSMYVFRDWIRDLDSMRPTKILDQHFGMGLTSGDLLPTLTTSPLQGWTHRNYYRPWRTRNTDTGSIINSDKNKFQVNLDVQQFSPEEINVKVLDNFVVVEGKHEEKEDEHGFISRQFIRKYLIPKEYQIEFIQSTLSSDGVLTISVPKIDSVDGEKIIPITQTGEPHKAVKETEEK